ncbi:DUF6602 domain-containing protein [Mesonia mobilis]|uniref:DUF6602 domain-containing protein n=1 Tax=Mesonia mobilis TaxID=369791 RepID=A0ABQ3BYH2_9FLAO|nr:DUF6602 domain-containing protein [Mesonia mobilis]MBQ0738543.1 hypothetical protein [Aquimarina celericrescens]GGZ56512.1 hypothetical protein GCM10008088_17610 [Mesonia mobilis]
MSKKVNLQSLFRGLQDQMTAQLNTNREYIYHPGSKGDSLENAWIEWLKKYLPNRYSVDKAIIIDHKGNTSDQIDVVIYDNWFTPFIFSQNGFHYIPAEGVYAVFEVKPQIKGNVGQDNFIEYSAKKIESVRVLERTSSRMINSGIETKPRPLTKIVGGILVTDNGYRKDKTIIDHIKSQQGLRSIDFGCIANYGSFYVDYQGEEDLLEKDFYKRYLDYYSNRKYKKLEFSKMENSMVTFFMQLTRYLQQAIGTVAAINLQSYLDRIDEKIDEEI